nr:helix-turn-helix domain-containing protein [Actinomycetospora corticicola]
MEAAAPSSSAEVVDDSGVVSYEGAVRLHGEVSWRIDYSPSAALGLPAAPTAEVLAALGHPVRLALVRRLLTGPASAAELQDAAELSSTGQVYHHLRALTAARVVEQDGRSFRVPATGVVPVLTMLLAAGDVAGLLR